MKPKSLPTQCTQATSVFSSSLPWGLGCLGVSFPPCPKIITAAAQRWTTGVERERLRSYLACQGRSCNDGVGCAGVGLMRMMCRGKSGPFRFDLLEWTSLFTRRQLCLMLLSILSCITIRRFLPFRLEFSGLNLRPATTGTDRQQALRLCAGD
ncbi:hypothetical protein VTK26DRAFT_5849 [Humicola hyalothermophila]